jgi:hypothetical protein
VKPRALRVLVSASPRTEAAVVREIWQSLRNGVLKGVELLSRESPETPHVVVTDNIEQARVYLNRGIRVVFIEGPLTFFSKQFF